MKQALKSAEIQYEVDGRKADFHALRYTFITNLIKAGEPPAYVQRLARHSDINLTYRVYTDLGLEDLYHGLLRGGQTSTSRTNGTQEDVPQEQGDKPSDEGVEDGNGSKSVARNVAHISGRRRLLVSGDVTNEGTESGATEPSDGGDNSPQMQKATGVNTSCRSMSQKKQKRRGQDAV